MMASLTLTKGYVAIIDDEDFEFLSRWKWCASQCGQSFYAMRGQLREGKQQFFYLHRIILNAQKGQYVDHIDGDTMNNSRNNLRIVTAKQNSANMKKHKDGVSQFKGVSPNLKLGKPWVAGIVNEGKRKHLGTFSSEIEAAMAYDAAAKIRFGEYAKLNFGDKS
jgi:hypothetical protein